MMKQFVLGATALLSSLLSFPSFCLPSVDNFALAEECYQLLLRVNKAHLIVQQDSRCQDELSSAADYTSYAYKELVGQDYVSAKHHLLKSINLLAHTEYISCNGKDEITSIKKSITEFYGKF
jgi:hypothetical protein